MRWLGRAAHVPQRREQALRSKDGKDLCLIMGSEPVDDPVAAPKHLPYIGALELWNDAPRFGKVFQASHGVDDVIDGETRVVRRVLGNVVVDSLEVLTRLWCSQDCGHRLN